MMTIEIDDSGTGDMVGSAFVGIYRIETGELLFKEIPIHLFDEYGFDMKLPKLKTLDLIIEGLKELKYNRNETIHICQGNIFDYVRSYFRKNKISFENCSIKGELQKTIEERYLSYLDKIGFKIKPEFKPKFSEDYPFRNRMLKNWVCRDFKNRLKYIKAGLKKSFENLLKLIQEKYNFDEENILEYHIQDSILTLEKYCERDNYLRPSYYFFIENKWKNDSLIPLLLENGNDLLVGVSIRKKDIGQYYSDDFEFEQNDKNSLIAVGKGKVSKYSVREAKLRASVKICDILNLTYKSFVESNY